MLTGLDAMIFQEKDLPEPDFGQKEFWYGWVFPLKFFEEVGWLLTCSKPNQRI